jgi:hypothetical protein
MGSNRNSTAGALKKFRRTAMTQQQCTFRTPLQSLEPFVSVALVAMEPVQVCQFVIDQIIFEPGNVERAASAKFDRGSANAQNNVRA